MLCLYISSTKFWYFFFIMQFYAVVYRATAFQNNLGKRAKKCEKEFVKKIAVYIICFTHEHSKKRSNNLLKIYIFVFKKCYIVKSRNTSKIQKVKNIYLFAFCYGRHQYCLQVLYFVFAAAMIIVVNNLLGKMKSYKT